MADSDPTKLSVEEQVARIKAAKEAAKKAAADKAAGEAAAKSAPATQAAAPVAPPAPAAPVAKAPPAVPVPPPATVAEPDAAEATPAAATTHASPLAAAATPASATASAAPPAAPPAPGSVEEKVAQIKAAKAAAAEKAKAAAAAKEGGAPAAAAPAPGSVEEKVAQIKAAKAAAAAKNAGGAAPAGAAGVTAATATGQHSGPKAVPPGTPEAIARAAAAHEKAQGATGINAHGTPANRPAVQLLAAAAAKPGVAKTAAKKTEPEGPLPPPPQLQPRRKFLGFLSLGTATWVIFFTWLAGVGHLFLRFMFPNVLYEGDPKFNAGRKSDFPESPHVYENFKQSQAVWVVRLTEEGQDRLVALSTVCTHLGCTPNWLEAENKFKCPCHGSGYYINGVNFEGPTPRPLERYRIFVDIAGNIIVDKSKKYRQDLQQWNENQSFLTMG